MKIIVDAMGGDNAPEANVFGCVDAVNQVNGFEVILVGKEEEIHRLLSKSDYPKDRIKVVNALEVITNDDKPTKAAKEKKGSSMVVGVRMLKNKEGDVFVSAGNTGALMTVSLLNLGRIKGIDRPALSFFFPAKKGPVMVIDVGANTICKPENFLQFGIMGSIYMRELFGLMKPRVGLVNVGTEDQKGNDTIKHAFNLLNNSKINFMGNIESREIPNNGADVVVCDGFVGNVILKLSEGIAEFFISSLKSIFKANIVTKFAFVIVKKSFKKFFKSIDYREYGSTPLLGINGKVMKAHGSSDKKAIKHSIISAYRFGKSNVIDMIEEEFMNLGGHANGKEL